MAMTFDKAGTTFEIISGGTGRVMTKCRCEDCKREPRWLRADTLPCGCVHAMIVDCSCPLKDKHCRRCRRSFIPSGRDWYEVLDPHGQAGH